MPAAALLYLTIDIETVVIAILLLLLLRIGSVGVDSRRQLVRARRERDEARKVLATLRRMSEIRLETVARLKGFGQESQ